MAFTHFTVSLRTFTIVAGATRHLLPWFCFELQPSLIWVGASKWKIIVSFTPSLFHCVTFHCFTVDIRTSMWGPLNICFRGFALIFNPLSFGRENIHSSEKCDNHKYHCFFFLGFPSTCGPVSLRLTIDQPRIRGSLAKPNAVYAYVFSGTVLLQGCFFSGGCIHSTNTNTGTSTVLVLTQD